MKRILFIMFISIISMLYVAQAQDFSITIDAEKDSWYNGLTGPADGQVFMPAKCFLRDIGDGNGPDNDADLSGIVWMAHHSLYLYLYAEVKDDIINGSNAARYLNDCLELKFDPEPSEGGNYTALLNTRLTVLGDAGVGGIDNLTGLPGYSPEEGVDYARKITGDGYALEFRMPIENIEAPDGRSLYFNETGKMGLAINIGDNDTGVRDNMLQWSAGHSDAAHSDLKLLGTVSFLADHKLGFEALSIIDPNIINENADDWYSNPNPNGISDAAVEIKSYRLLANYPNPFNPETTIKYEIPENERVKLNVYNIRGKEIAVLVNDFRTAGTYSVLFNGANFASGVYFYRLQSNGYNTAKRMLLLK